MISELVTLGRLDGAWGVKGWVRVYSWTDPAEAIFDYQPWHLDHKIVVTEWRRSGPRLVARLEGVATPDEADRLRHMLIRVPRERLPELPDDQFYWQDLENLQVVNRDGAVLGRVKGLMATGAHDVLVLGGDPERLIPFVVGHYVIAVDLKNQQIQVDWPAEWMD